MVLMYVVFEIINNTISSGCYYHCLLMSVMRVVGAILRYMDKRDLVCKASRKDTMM